MNYLTYLVGNLTSDFLSNECEEYKLIAKILTNHLDLKNLSTLPQYIIETILFNFVVVLNRDDKGKHLDTVKYLYSLIKNKNFKTTDHNDMTNPLIYACSNGKYEIVKILIENGANINYISKNNTTPIMYAAQHNHYDIVIYLLSLDAIYETREPLSKQLLQRHINDYADIKIQTICNEINKIRSIYKSKCDSLKNTYDSEKILLLQEFIKNNNNNEIVQINIEYNDNKQINNDNKQKIVVY